MRVYRYWAKPAGDAAEREIHRQLWLAGDYRRALATAENGERAAVAALYLEDPEIAAHEAAIQAAVALKDTTTTTRLREELRGLRIKRSRDAGHKTELAKIRERRGPLLRGIRGHFADAGLFWGTYLLVEDAHDRAVRETVWWDRITVRGPWNSLGVQIQSAQRKLTGHELRAGRDTRVKLSAEPYALLNRQPARNVYDPRAPEHPKPHSFRTLSIRTGSVPGKRTPIWTDLHVLIEPVGHRHKNLRQIADDARIVWVKLCRVGVLHHPGVDAGRTRMIARERWEVQFIVDEPEARSHPAASAATATVGIDIGWRRVDGGIRTAYAATATGFEELVIPDSILSLSGKADSIRSVCDLCLDGVRAELVRRRSTAPPDIADALAYAHSWRRVGHFVAAARRIQEALTDARPDVLTWLAGDPWFMIGFLGALRRDGHLRQYAVGLRRQQQDRVCGRTQGWIAKVLTGHGVVGVEQPIRIDRMRARATAETTAGRMAAVAHTATSPGQLREWILQMAASRGIIAKEINPAMTTRMCGACGVDRGPCVELFITCPECGYTEDQDRTAARTLQRIASGEIPAPGAAPLADAVTGTSAKPKAFRRNRKAPKEEMLASADVTL
jgi:hypothetical protein